MTLIKQGIRQGMARPPSQSSEACARGVQKSSPLCACLCLADAKDNHGPDHVTRTAGKIIKSSEQHAAYYETKMCEITMIASEEKKQSTHCLFAHSLDVLALVLAAHCCGVRVLLSGLAQFSAHNDEEFDDDADMKSAAGGAGGAQGGGGDDDDEETDTPIVTKRVKRAPPPRQKARAKKEASAAETKVRFARSRLCMLMC